MVYFNCGACGEALRKNQVEKHFTVCRKCQVVSCVDCGKDFWGHDFKEHTKCITEAEKYSGKNYSPKINKGEAKQDKWLQQVREAIEKNKSNPKIKNLLVSLEDFPNIPRKKIKFENFLANSLRIRDRSLVSQVWDILMVPSSETTSDSSTSTNFPKIEEPVTNTIANSKDIPEENVCKKVTVTQGASSCEDTSEENKEKKHHKKKKHKKNHVSETQNQDDNGNCIIENGKGKKHNNTSKKKKDQTEKTEKIRKKKHKIENVEETDLEDLQPKDKKKNRVSDTDLEKVVTNGERSSHKNSKKRRLTEELASDETKSKKLKAVNEEVNEESPTQQKDHRFNWEKAISKVLKAKGELSLAKLWKKVLSEYVTRGYVVSSEEKLLKKFNKKISNNPLFKVHKERITLQC